MLQEVHGPCRSPWHKYGNSMTSYRCFSMLTESWAGICSAFLQPAYGPGWPQKVQSQSKEPCPGQCWHCEIEKFCKFRSSTLKYGVREAGKRNTTDFLPISPRMLHKSKCERRKILIPCKGTIMTSMTNTEYAINCWFLSFRLVDLAPFLGNDSQKTCLPHAWQYSR